MRFKPTFVRVISLKVDRCSPDSVRQIVIIDSSRGLHPIDLQRALRSYFSAPDAPDASQAERPD